MFNANCREWRWVVSPNRSASSVHVGFIWDPQFPPWNMPVRYRSRHDIYYQLWVQIYFFIAIHYYFKCLKQVSTLYAPAPPSCHCWVLLLCLRGTMYLSLTQTITFIWMCTNIWTVQTGLRCILPALVSQGILNLPPWQCYLKLCDERSYKPPELSTAVFFLEYWHMCCLWWLVQAANRVMACQNKFSQEMNSRNACMGEKHIINVII